MLLWDNKQAFSFGFRSIFERYLWVILLRTQLSAQSNKQYSFIQTTSTAGYFYRHPVNCALRDSYSDIYMNVYSSDDVPSEDELGFYQQYRIIPYVGSRQKEKIVYESFIGEDNPLHEDGPFDVTIVSQTS